MRKDIITTLIIFTFSLLSRSVGHNQDYDKMIISFLNVGQGDGAVLAIDAHELGFNLIAGLQQGTGILDAEEPRAVAPSDTEVRHCLLPLTRTGASHRSWERSIYEYIEGVF